MLSFLDQVCDQINLRWAWEKVKRASVPGDIWINEAELSFFELHLGKELEHLAKDLKEGRYQITPLRPMAFPKNPDEHGKSRVRQYFNFSIKDQVAWTAVVNIVGPYVDAKMPVWSYGNRLFRSTWIDEDEIGKSRKTGPYRHSSGRIYRPFQQAWPLFRRHIALALSAATATSNIVEHDLDQDDLDELNVQRSLSIANRCPYVLEEYWTRPVDPATRNEVYWASIDLEKFFPSILLTSCVDAIVSCLPESFKESAAGVLKGLSHLPLDFSDWEDKDLSHIGLQKDSTYFPSIPTGLLVSGFLANAALLRVDHAVERDLPRGSVAHFRYVDDHVVVATNFEELVKWLRRYKEILDEFGGGAKVNPSKTEPAELGEFFSNETVASVDSDYWIKAKKACLLDPDFPSPLMTRTIALVSAIGRTDFTILDETELNILSRQLEHLLLVDLPESEMPERTRLAFAATRLARVAEVRLSSPELLTKSADYRQSAALQRSYTRSLFDRNAGESELARLTGIDDPNVLKQLEGIANRAFNLVRRVLRERPDRVRLWTHALSIARRLGASGLTQLFSDIREYSNDPINRLSARYILGNSYAVLASEVINASQVLTDRDAAGWRKAASLRFLRDVATCTANEEFEETDCWFVQLSYNQLCVGMYCAKQILQKTIAQGENFHFSFKHSLISTGEALLISRDITPIYRVALAWWGARFEMRQPIRKASDLIVHLGSTIQELPESDAFWIFFPGDAPVISMERVVAQKGQNMEGWWFDALNGRTLTNELQHVVENSVIASRVQERLDKTEQSRYLSLPVWAEAIWKNAGSEEFRLGEWTCLEVIRQAAVLFAQEETLSASYLERASKPRELPCAHPLNFQLPSEIIKTPVTSWLDWQQRLRANGKGVVRFSPSRQRLRDDRYAPLVSSRIGSEQNSIRGLGLCLFGLLSRSFLLPVQWNGAGHESLLKYLPQLLREEITYSSATLGILEACLLPRSSENVLANLNQTWSTVAPFDDDTTHDPIRLIDTRQLAEVIGVAQRELERNQISTLNHRPRQLTPISLFHLTEVDWKSYFGGEAT